MSDRWQIKLDAWPFSAVADATFPNKGLSGQVNDYKLSGPEKREFEVQAEDARGALRAAELIIQGIKSSGHVWEVKIRSIVEKERG
jgi:hypothetical protein